MNKPLTLALTLTALATVPLVTVPLAQAGAPMPPAATTPGTAAPAPVPAADPAQLWTQVSLQAATYVVLPPTLDGNLGLLSPDQQKSVLAAMGRDLQGAMLRKYPAAHFVTDVATPGVIALHPVLTVPGSFFGSFQAKLELSRSGSSAVVQSTFGVLEVYAHQADAANYVFDRLAVKLP